MSTVRKRHFRFVQNQNSDFMAVSSTTTQPPCASVFQALREERCWREREDKRRHYQKCRVYYIQKAQVWRAANQEKSKQASRSYYIRHRAERIANARKWAANNREAVNRHRRTYYAKHPERFTAKRAKLRAARKAKS